MSGRPPEDLVLPGEIARLHPRQGVVVRRFDLAAPELETAWVEARIVDEDRAKAERLIIPGHRERAKAARALLRACLSDVTGRAPQRLTFDVGPQGKPWLAGGGPSFSLSHSQERLLVAVAETGEDLGVDVELPAIPRRLDAAQRFSARPEEAVVLEALAEPAKTRAVLRLWTAKEAALKAIGTGLTQSMKCLALAPEGLESLGLGFWRPVALSTEQERIAIADVSIADDIACLAVRDQRFTKSAG